MQLASLIISSIVALFGIAIALRGRQLSRPSLRLHFGVTSLDPTQPRLVRTLPKRVAIYGLPDLQRDYFVVPLAIGIENQSPVAITSFQLQIEYPSECLLDNTDVTDFLRGKFPFGDAVVPGRKANRFATLAHVTYDFEMLGPNQKMTIYELVRVPRDHVPGIADNPYQAALNEQWNTTEGFCSALNIELSLFAANCSPAGMRAVLVAVLAADEEELTGRAGILMSQIWRGTTSRTILPWRRPPTQLAEITLLTKDALVVTERHEIDPTILRSARTAVLKFKTPPWEVSGESPER